MDTVYFEYKTNKLTFTDWHRGGFPFIHFPGDALCGMRRPYSAILKKSADRNYFGMDEFAILSCYTDSLQIVS